LRRNRTALLVVALISASFCIICVQKIFEYSAAPEKEKQNDFIFPATAEQEKPTSIIADPKPPLISFEQRGGFINDASHLNKTAVYAVVSVANENDIRNALAFARANNLKIACAGQRHSMGGQSFTQGGVVLNFKDFNRIVMDKQRKKVNVQSGVRWWQLQQLLDENGLSVKSMQSINIFSIGGTLSVNAHGIDPVPGPIAPTVRSMRIMLSNGDVVQTSPTENSELFRHVLGGYGLFGVILDADLDVVDNEMYVRKAEYMNFEDFPAYYKKNIEDNSNVGLVYGRLSVAPQSYLREAVIHTYEKTPFEGTLPPLLPAEHNTLDRLIINCSKRGSVGRWIRWMLEKYAEPRLQECVGRNQSMSQKGECLVTRNEDMYDDMAYLQNRLPDTDILQEYFVPYDRMKNFVDGLRDVVQRNQANLINVTIRTVHKDAISALPYAKQDMFAFVLYFNVKFNVETNEILRKTTSDLIDVVQNVGGTYYLPYQLFYSREQLKKSYPEIDDFFATKRKYDPINLFSNKFYEKYGL